MTRVGFIGLGAMGAHMARNLMRAGHALGVYARRAETLDAFRKEGAATYATPAELAAQSEVVFTNVTTTQDVIDVILGEAGVIRGAKPGSVVIDHSTIDVQTTRDIAAKLGARGIDMLDAPVSGGAKGAENATLSIMVGGKAEVLTRVMPLLQCLGKTIIHLGDHGAGQVCKACNQIVQVVNIQGIAEAMLFARHNGVDLGKVVQALMAGFAGSKMLELEGPKIAQRDFTAGIEARLHHKDFGLIADMAREQHLPMPAVGLVLTQLNALMCQGWGALDTCNLLRVLEAAAGLEQPPR
jgi:3-hydroxyisobutyrate dehydrogenase-like beta-hydroxyacid dehydrogenase